MKVDVKFKMGKGELPSQEAGSFIVKTDTHELLIDTNEGERISLGSISLTPIEGGNALILRNVVGIPVNISTEDTPYYLLSIKKEIWQNKKFLI